MGMFDNINVVDKLPYTEEMISLGLDINNSSFQTKDLINCMETYCIQGGKLFLQKFKVDEWVESGGVFDMGYVKREDPYLELINHHGEIYFYNFIPDVKGTYDCWVEFKAVFSNGNLDRFELVEFKKTDNAERKASEKKFLEEHERARKIWYNKYFLNTRPYRWFSHKVWYRSCNALGRFFHWLSYKL